MKREPSRVRQKTVHNDKDSCQITTNYFDSRFNYETPDSKFSCNDITHVQRIPTLPQKNKSKDHPVAEKQ